MTALYSETSVNIYQPRGPNNPEDLSDSHTALLSHRKCKNLSILISCSEKSKNLIHCICYDYCYISAFLSQKQKRVLKILSCILLYVLSKIVVVQIIVGVGFVGRGCLYKRRGYSKTNDGLPAVVCTTVRVERKKRMKKTQKNTHIRK
jgi:hypothetical protein